jgi:hypothetical protein
MGRCEIIQGGIMVEVWTDAGQDETCTVMDGEKPLILPIGEKVTVNQVIPL